VVVREGEALVLQVRSPLQGGGADEETPKKVRARLRGIKARRLAAHRRLIAAISVSDGVFLFSGSAGTGVDAAVGASAAMEESDAGLAEAVVVEVGPPPLPPLLLLLLGSILLPIVSLAAGSLTPSVMGGLGKAVVAWAF
jgi:hypothetical protein